MKEEIRILLVEDNPGDARLIKEMLKEAGGKFKIFGPCTSLAACMEQARADSFDVVLLDLGLPDSQGLATFRAMNEALPGIPIIILTGLRDEDMAVSAVKAGAQDYLFKGATEGDLLAKAIRYAIERKWLDERIRVRAGQQAAIAALGQKALAGESLGSLFDGAAAMTAKVLGAELCKVLELMPDGKSLLLRAGVGWKEGLVGSALVGAGPDSHAGYTLMSDQPVVVEDLPAEDRFSGPPLLTEHGAISGISVIIGGREKSYGVFGAHTRRKRAFTEDDVNFMQSVANILADAIARERAETQLRESEARYQNLFENSPVSLWELDLSGVRTYLDGLVNGGVTDLAGHFKADKDAALRCARGIRIMNVNLATLRLFRAESIDELVANFGCVFTDSFTASFAEQAAALDGGGAGSDYECMARNMDGEDVYISIKYSLAPGREKDLSLLFASVVDVTERKKVEEVVRSSAKKWRDTFDAINDAVGIVDLQCGIQQCNSAMVSLLGGSYEQVIGKECWEFFLDTPGLAEEWPLVRMKQTLTRESSVLCLRDRCFNISADPILDSNGKLSGAVFIMADITERRAAEEELRKKMDELERFYEMAVGRELKMKALKKEIERLKAEVDKCTKDGKAA